MQLRTDRRRTHFSARHAMPALARGIPSERIATAGPNVSWHKGSGSTLIGEVGFSPAKAGFLQGSPPAEAKDDFVPISKIAVGSRRTNSASRCLQPRKRSWT